MPRSIILLSSLLLALLSYRGLAEAEATTNKQLIPPFFNDIVIDDEPAVTGSGSGKIPYSDDEDFGLSGSGSGSGDHSDEEVQTTPRVKVMTMESTTTTTRVPLSDCEQMQQTNRVLGRKEPNCENGVYASLQCAGEQKESDCWCSDKIGKKIPGTVMEPPNFPDCDYGSNLAPCLHQLVMAMRQDLIGGIKPTCTQDGQYHPVQCTGSVCYCVDKNTGAKDSSTLVHSPDIPDCSDDSEETQTNTGIDNVIPVEPTDIVDSSEDNDGIIKLEPDSEDTDTTVVEIPEGKDKDDNINIDKGSNNGVKNVDDYTDSDEDDSDENKINSGVDDQIKNDRLLNKETKIKAANPIMAQPGLLAGIIGGSVVVALCLVLLIMFIIYRMRKKDEGSYPLDEPRKPPKYPYMRAPEREFYA